MADVFISYSRKDRAIAKALADDLTDHGFWVWWDFDIYGGDNFHDLIRAEIAKAKAVIVIWSKTASDSTWVRGEAEEALDHGTLIPTVVDNFDVRHVPLNFRGFHCEPVENRARIIAALERKGIKSRYKDSLTPSAPRAGVSTGGATAVEKGFFRRTRGIFIPSASATVVGLLITITGPVVASESCGNDGVRWQVARLISAKGFSANVGKTWPGGLVCYAAIKGTHYDFTYLPYGLFGLYFVVEDRKRGQNPAYSTELYQ